MVQVVSADTYTLELRAAVEDFGHLHKFSQVYAETHMGLEKETRWSTAVNQDGGAW